MLFLLLFLIVSLLYSILKVLVLVVFAITVAETPEPKPLVGVNTNDILGGGADKYWLAIAPLVTVKEATLVGS